MLTNPNFYPTPPNLISKMLAKIKGQPGKILEPSAGKGDLIKGIRDRYTPHGWTRSEVDVSAIEIDPTLQATLRGKGIKVLDSDFLAYAGPDKFDAIIMNPPFDDGDKHLLKAIDIMYRGQIVCLLNAETLRNPHTKNRKLLLRKLDELGAEIEYIKGAFKDAERKTGVEIALVYIQIDRKVEDDLFADCSSAARCYETVSENHEVSTGRTIAELVAEYNQAVQCGTDVILNYFRNHRKVAKYIGLNQEAKNYDFDAKDLTGKMQTAVNDLLKAARTDYWRRTLDIEEVRNRLTEKKMSEFEHNLNERCHMDFTESNIRQFVLNLIGSYEQTLTEAVLDLFDFCTRHGYRSGVLHEKNIWFFNGWKTNDSFAVGKRVVLPIGHERAFRGWYGWQLDWDAEKKIRDIDTVMAYFSGMEKCVTLRDAMAAAFAKNENSGQSSYFKFTAHKKGTLHLTFLDLDILRRFNVVACRGKGWLPEDYGAKGYAQLGQAEKAVVDAFEGKLSYARNLNQPLFRTGKLLQIAA